MNLLLSLTLLLASLASEGDQGENFQDCLIGCVQMQPQVFPLVHRVLLWDQRAECKYQCMRQDTKQRRHQGLRTLQYYGKWPFVRVLGMQEPLSVVSSVLNAVAHWRGFFAFYAGVHWRQRNLLHILFLYLNTVCWGLSALFHTRDTWLTERLDYFGAAALVIYGTYMAVATVFPWTTRQRVRMAIAFVAFYLYHVTRLSIHFDYGYNMRILVCFGLVFNLTWIVGYLGKRLHDPLAWKVPTAMLLAGAFELYDFAPIGDFLDAHALWHVLTIPLGYLWWKVFRHTLDVHKAPFPV